MLNKQTWHHMLQLKDLILRSLKHFQAVFVHGNSMDLPEIRLELAVDENTIIFYPSKADFGEFLDFVVHSLCKAMQKVRDLTTFF